MSSLSETLAYQDIIQETKDLVVAQSYVDSHVLNATKYDMRVYMMITRIEPLIAYVHREYVIRLASAAQDQQLSDSEETELRKQDVTNAAYGGRKLTRTQFLEMLFSNKNPEELNVCPHATTIDECDRYIHAEIENTIKTVLSQAEKYLKKQTTIPRSFSLYGVDIVPTYDGFKLLEINYCPSMNAQSEEDAELKQMVVQDMFELARIPANTRFPIPQETVAQ